MSADALLEIVAGRDTTGLFEVRCRSPRSGRIEAREWISVTDMAACGDLIRAHARKLDVYVGACPRTKRDGGKAAIAHAWCLWADIDESSALDALGRFEPRPSLIVRSGTDSNVHAYWALSQPLKPYWVEQANRRLAHHLGADMKATDAARILRPPGTLNWKHDPPTRVEIEYVDSGSRPVEVFRLLKNLPDLLGPNPPRRQHRPSVVSDDPLLGVSADTYYSVLTGRPVTVGNVTCPFHGEGKERNGSLRLYETTWYCFTCCAGGSIYQFAAHLWNMDRPRGDDFKRLRERLTDALSR